MGGSTTVIAAACATAAAVVVVSLLVILLVKILNKKQASGEQQATYVEQNNFESIDGFSGGLSVSHIEEDPFASDFKEDKFINQI